MSFLNVFGFVMALVYTGLGISLLLASGISVLSDFQRIGLGILLAVYGLFRLYNTYRKKKENEQDDDDE